MKMAFNAVNIGLAVGGLLFVVGQGTLAGIVLLVAGVAAVAGF